MPHSYSAPHVSQSPGAQLAIDCCGRGGSVAWCDGEDVLYVETIAAGIRSAAGLTPAILQLQQQVRQAGQIAPDAPSPRPNFISVTAGPGSFTGLRIGVTTAKSLAYAWGIPVVGVDTLHAMVQAAFRGASNWDREVVAVLRGYRGLVYVFQGRASALIPDPRSDDSSHLNLARVMPVAAACEIVANSPVDTVLVGDAFDHGPGSDGDAKPFVSPAGKIVILDQHREHHSGEFLADSVGQLGHQMWSRGIGIEDATRLMPRYLRPSAAEEKAAERSGKRDAAAANMMNEKNQNESNPNA